MRCLWAIVRWARISVIAASLVPERNFIDSGYVILTAVNLEIKRTIFISFAGNAFKSIGLVILCRP